MLSNWHLHHTVQQTIYLRRLTMFALPTFSHRFIAAAAALALSLVMINATVDVPAGAIVQAQQASTYVGAVA
jgi:hypothetical protein